MNFVNLPEQPIVCQNFIGGHWTHATGSEFAITSPYTGQVIGHSRATSAADLEQALSLAQNASYDWGQTPIKERSQIMYRFRQTLLERADEIAHRAASECGKTVAEAKAGLLKGVEVLEFALSLQNLDTGGRMEVSRGVSCEYRREPLGVVAGVTPFNFPAMVPMWMLPVAITLGNSFVWKPSDKTPLTSMLIADCLHQSGLPPGVLTVVQGGRETVQELLKHPVIKAVGFVGSTSVAKSIYQEGTKSLKRVLALGGAKNHILLVPDADPQLAAKGIAESFTGCAGQRCMAASVLLAVRNVDSVIDGIVETVRNKKICQEMGAIISEESLQRLHSAIAEAEKNGARILVDGRNPKIHEKYASGYWLNPTILDNVSPDSQAACEELFGPILSIVRCTTVDEAIKIENSNPYGNAASVFTQNGAIAETIARRSRAGMVGINVGVPVPREPFSFGGFYESKFGYGDITGIHSLDFWSQVKKITTKWAAQSDQNWMS